MRALKYIVNDCSTLRQMHASEFVYFIGSLKDTTTLQLFALRAPKPVLKRFYARDTLMRQSKKFPQLNVPNKTNIKNLIIESLKFRHTKARLGFLQS